MQWLRSIYKHKFGIYNYVQTQGGYNEPLHSIISITITGSRKIFCKYWASFTYKDNIDIFLFQQLVVHGS